MRLPNKVTSYKDSIIPSSVKVLKELNNTNDILDIFKNSNSTLSNFIEILCFLYSIGKIQLNEKGEIENVIGNK